MTGPGEGGTQPGRWRLAILAGLFALIAQGCFVLATELSRNPF
jgi:hypothetical protein